MAIIRNIILLTGAILAVFVGLKIKTLVEDAPVPVLRKDVWWGRGERRPEDPAIRGYKIEVADSVITDLSDRLDKFLKKPITPPLENIQFQYGFNTDYLRTVIQYWKDKYLPKWRDHQKKLNSYPQFVTTVNGLKLHYIRVSPPAPEGKRVLPLLILHGWPGSVREFYDIIPLLTRPNEKTDFIFEVIAPSLPGYGFSEGAAKPGMGPAEMAVVLNNLMAKLGFNKYYVQGGDWGAVLAKSLGQLYPNTILGAHSNMCFVTSQLALIITAIGSQIPIIVVDKHQEHFMYPFGEKVGKLIEETGYYHLQATKPDTIGVALGDTPTGLAAYILEKFITWTNPSGNSLSDGNLGKKFSLDALLDNIMLYWVTNSATTSARLYSEAKRTRSEEQKLDRIMGIHSNMCVVNSALSILMTAVGEYMPLLVVSSYQQHLMYPLTHHLSRLIEEHGYLHILATKPDTIGISMGDSPAGLAAFILEKFSTWTNLGFKSEEDGGLDRSFSMDALLDNVMIYWISDSFTTAARLYAEGFSSQQLKLRLEQILGMHSNMCSVRSTASEILTAVGSFVPSLVVKPEHQHLMYPVGKHFAFLMEELGYMHLQATKPDTIGTVLSDSPAGLAAYILEKFVTWTNPEFKNLPDGGLTQFYQLDDLLDNIMIYWATNSITTSQRLYSEAFTYNQMDHKLLGEVPLLVPAACARFHSDLAWQSEAILRLQHRNLVQVTDYADGGHFAAFQLPQVLAIDVIGAIDKMEKLRKQKK